MSTKKVTVTLEAGQVGAIGRLVAAGTTRSVSAFVQHAVATSLQDVAGWGDVTGDAADLRWLSPRLTLVEL